MTVTVAVPLCPSLVAVIVTGPPTLTAVTTPLEDTVTTLGLPDDQVTLRFVSRFPSASRRAAASCALAPGTSPVAGGVTDTDATGEGVGVVTLADGLQPTTLPRRSANQGVARRRKTAAII